MKLIIDIDDKTYKDVKQFYDNMSEHECIGEYELAIAEGIPLEFGNIPVEAIEELSHCPACIHYVQRDVPNAFCDKCVNRDELYRRIEHGVLEQIGEEQKTLLDTTKAWSKALEHGDIN